MTKTLYLNCKHGDVGELVLLTGSPERTELIANCLGSPKVVARNREFVTISGQYRNLKMSAVSSGIGAPSAAIAIEELKQLGVKAIVRVGTTMGVLAPIGHYVLSSGAARHEGTSRSYLDTAYPAVPSWSLGQQLSVAAKDRGLDLHIGVTASFDGFYPDMAPSITGHDSTASEEFDRAQILSIDMETALLYIMGQRMRIATASLCLVTNSYSPFRAIEKERRTAGELALVSTTLDALVAWHGQTT